MDKYISKRTITVTAEVTPDVPIYYMHRAALTIVPVVPWEGPPPPGAPDQLPYFYHAVLTFAGSVCTLKRNDDDKKVVNFWGKISTLPE